MTLGELKGRFENVTYQLVLECGGNGRSQFVPAGASGNPWTDGRRRAAPAGPACG